MYFEIIERTNCYDLKEELNAMFHNVAPKNLIDVKYSVIEYCDGSLWYSAMIILDKPFSSLGKEK